MPPTCVQIVEVADAKLLPGFKVTLGKGQDKSLRHQDVETQLRFAHKEIGKLFQPAKKHWEASSQC